MRRRLSWLAAILGVVGVIGLLVVLIPGRHDTEVPLVEGGYVPPKPEVPLRRRNRELVAPLEVASKFIQTAVARKNVADSWDIISPTYPGKSEYTRQQWAKADGLPVVPFQAERARWRLDYSFKNEVGLKVALFPPKNSDVPATVFDIDLVRRGKGENRRWLVDYFAPSGPGSTIITDLRSGGGGSNNRATGLPDLSPIGGAHRISRAWILVPVGILGLAILFPLALGIGYVVRVKRAERDFARAP